MTQATVDFLFDYASPFSYLANELLARKVPDATVEYVPIYLRGLDTFSKGVPFSGPKLAWLAQDLRRCAEHEGLVVNLPPTFPVNGLYALRGAIAAQRAGCFAAYHGPMFRAAWRDMRDVSNKAVVAEIAAELGLADVAGALDDPAIKEQLKANTETATRRGAFGAPTFFVGGDMFWGHDRLHHVATAVGAARG